MIAFLRKHLILLIGIVLGGLGGYLYYHFIGCDSGTCAITSKPLNSTIYGMVLGGLLSDFLKGLKKK
jgi:phage shock protein E